MRIGEWKVVKNGVTTNANAVVELYNLKTDPQEKKNVAAQNPAIIKQVEKILKAAYAPNEDWPLFQSEIKK